MYVYKITCKINNKVYIGQTCQDVRKRFDRHMGYHKDTVDTKFYRAVRKHGKNNFFVEIIDQASSQDELDDKEIYWINYYNAVEEGYNSKASKGKCGGDTLSNHPNKKAISEKIRASKMGDKNPMRINGGLKGKRNGMFGKYGELNHYSRKIVALNKDKSLYKVYGSLSDAKRDMGVTSLGMICNRLKGRTKSDYKGFYFMYYEDYIKSEETIEKTT